MPIYEYACPDCGHQFENIQKISDPLLTDCPECGADNLRKLVSATSFHLKGSGWYKDHYGLKSTPDASEGTSASASDSSDSSGSSGSGSSTAASSPASTTGGSESSGGASS